MRWRLHGRPTATKPTWRRVRSVKQLYAFTRTQEFQLTALRETTTRNVMTDGEEKLLAALVMMVNRRLTASDDEVDTLAKISPGEHAIEVLAEFGLRECQTLALGDGQRRANGFVEKWREYVTASESTAQGRYGWSGDQSRRTDPQMLLPTVAYWPTASLNAVQLQVGSLGQTGSLQPRYQIDACDPGCVKTPGLL